MNALLLHLHAAVREDIAELVLEGDENRVAFLFTGIALFEQIADFNMLKNQEIALKSTYASSLLC